jgi:hypothetical protein
MRSLKIDFIVAWLEQRCLSITYCHASPEVNFGADIKTTFQINPIYSYETAFHADWKLSVATRAQGARWMVRNGSQIWKLITMP